MGGFKDKKIKKDYPTREDAIAKTYSMIGEAVESLPKDMHPEIRAIYVKELIETGEQQIQIIKESEAWE